MSRYTEEELRRVERLQPESWLKPVGELLPQDFERLGEEVYLDHTGVAPFPASLLERHFDLLRRRVLGNPHSVSPSSSASSALVEEARQRILWYFGASNAEYSVVFTPNATGALDVVGANFPFDAGSRCAVTLDNHNSVWGMVVTPARRAGASIDIVPLTDELRIDEEAMALVLKHQPTSPSLLVYPAQSNFSGVKHPLGWIFRAQCEGWRVLLDAAAFVPTSRLDLHGVLPDFVTVSFYKMFGYPTGIGCLLVRNDALHLLQRQTFAGGAVAAVDPLGGRFCLTRGPEAYEDGTINFLGIPAVPFGLDHLESVGIDNISASIEQMMGWLLKGLQALRYTNGQAAVRIYGPKNTYMRGGTVAFNLLDRDGRLIDCDHVVSEAGKRGISLRSGCFCNPGAGMSALGITEEELAGCMGEICSAGFGSQVDARRCVERNGKGSGAVRVSLGLATKFADLWHFMAFLEDTVRKEEMEQ